MLALRIKLAVAKTAIVALKATGLFDSYFGHWRGQLFEYAQRRGFHILPVHYYSPIPVAKALKDKPGSFDLDEKANVTRVRELISSFDEELAEVFDKSYRAKHDYDPSNDGFSPLDASVLYSMIRTHKPKRIVEIGSGMSTLIAATAIQNSKKKDPNYSPRFTCIEPYPPKYLSPPPEEVTSIIAMPIQEVDRKYFDEFEPGDFLFIDSTHVAGYGSDVTYEFLEIIPRLPTGVHVHVHDIFLPYNYPASWIEEFRFFWNEQYLLEAALTFGNEFEVTAAVHSAYRTAGDQLASAFMSHPKHVIPASFWFTKKSRGPD